eukprot:TRINITY_DN12300_c0_g1_i3.p1 TRINITY_DN12300_c0_g1~~TRINITY_DN12300_c0_g1_i3.p1  ORF type:complete len:111 (+),score=6.22 TRINITY_DN12300_c0_g1_i3:157-489(+)
MLRYTGPWREARIDCCSGFQAGSGVAGCCSREQTGLVLTTHPRNTQDRGTASLSRLEYLYRADQWTIGVPLESLLDPWSKLRSTSSDSYGWCFASLLFSCSLRCLSELLL